MSYWAKMRGGEKSPPRVSAGEIFWSWLGAFLGIAAVALLHYRWLEGSDLLLIVGSFGASAVLIYGAPAGPLAQPRNLLGGHLVSALVGVACLQFFAPQLWLAAALAVATAIALMHLTKTLHPPGGATALIAVIGGEEIHQLGYWYLLFPIASGALIMLLVALLINNIPASRRYPVFWW
ncbi:HPP family protein [Desulfurivibrio alkaliphilus]|uniref:HPP family protein n=1 Tax=Desulfurivibrio alkaliphilus (strain DSM 19089 / UNIQEM U267 / AHT2) TaxID=589865 RepID=D6Z648_DESAT|nr:HPP family protein [Desulfurivibrio alkaliphilus]ADH86813.1 HPP family protein [Desulfurivibrio alkaliphilus AHT 2]